MPTSRTESSARWLSARVIALGYGNILFLGDGRLGLGVLALTFARVNVGFSSLWAALCALAFGRLLGLRPDHPQMQSGLANAILVGVVFGTLAKLDGSGLLLLALFSAGALILSLASQAVLSPLGVPIFSMPFSVMALLMGSFIPHSPSLYLLRPEFDHPTTSLPTSAVESLLAGLGTLFGGEGAWIGALLLVLLFIRSRFALLSAVLGLMVGWGIETALGAPEAPFRHFPTAYNEALAAVALGAVFMVPSLRATFFAVLGAALTVLYADGLRALMGDVPVYTLPFFLSVGTLLTSLRLAGTRGLAERPDLPAEKNLERALSLSQRFQLHQIHLGNPIVGRWTVSQGREGRHTHQPPWAEAIDFVMTDGRGKTYRSTGRFLTDYHAFNRPVLSPVNGTVVELVGNRPDCMAGIVDSAFPWGNHIVIRTLDGLHVVLAHLRKDSVLVLAGQYVSEGTVLAAIGNSGYSPEPHLHLHVQGEAPLGSATLPFRFVSYLVEGQMRFSEFPSEGQTVEFTQPDPLWDQSFTFLLDGRMIFQGPQGAETLTVRMEPGTGLFHFLDTAGNRLHFSKNRHYFCCFRYEGSRGSFLEGLQAALPRLPLCGRQGMEWKDSLPISVALSRLAGIGAYALAAWITPPKARLGAFRLSEDGSAIVGTTCLQGRSTAVLISFDPARALREVRIGTRRYMRVL